MDIDRYLALRDAGKTPLQVAYTAIEDDLSIRATLEMLRIVFAYLSFTQRKALCKYARGEVKSTRKFIPSIQQFMDDQIDKLSDS